VDSTKKIWQIDIDQKSTKKRPTSPNHIFQFYPLFSHPEPPKTWKPQHPEGFSKRSAAPARPRVAKARISYHQATASPEWANAPMPPTPFKGGGGEAHVYFNVGKTMRINHPWLGMVTIPPIKMVMTGGFTISLMLQGTAIMCPRNKGFGWFWCLKPISLHKKCIYKCMLSHIGTRCMLSHIGKWCDFNPNLCWWNPDVCWFKSFILAGNKICH
jgi:hypothetical protein